MAFPLSVLSSRRASGRRKVAPNHHPPDASPPSAEGGPSLLSRCARFALVGYGAILLLPIWWGARPEPLQLEDLLDVPRWVAGVLAAALLAGGQFALLGLLAALAIGGAGSRRWAMVFLGAGVFLLLWIARGAGVPALVAGLFPIAGYLMGAWIGATSLKGWLATFWLLPKLGLLLTALAAGLGALGLLAVDDQSLPFEPPKVTSADKRRLVDVLEHPSRTGEGWKRLHLSEHDANLLLAMTIPQVLPQGKARIDLERAGVRGDLSVAAAESLRRPRWINVEAECQVEVVAGLPDVRITRCRVGRVRVPAMLLDAFSTALGSAILADPDLEPLIAAIHRLRVEPGGVELVYEGGDFGDTVIPSLVARVAQNPDVRETARLYVRHLVRSAEALPGNDRFLGFLQAAFELAEARSQVEDPVLENRAAVLALAILLGHWRVETLVGPVTDSDLRAAARRHVGRVALRDRRDWCQHFFVSAAVALLSNESVSDQVGLLKEELDAGKGGSGFSFSDLMADRAGTLFALAATRDEPSARRMQARLAAGAAIDEVFPPAADLAEGIMDRQFETEYGGVGGKNYLGVLGEIERRLADCSALR